MNYEIYISYSFSIGRIFIIRNINSVSWGRVMFSCRDIFVCWKSIKSMGHSVHNMSYSLYVSVFTFGFVHASHQSRAQGSWWCFMVSVVQKVRPGLTFLYGTCICARHLLSMLKHGSIPLSPCVSLLPSHHVHKSMARRMAGLCKSCRCCSLRKFYCKGESRWAYLGCFWKLLSHLINF